MVTTFVAYPLDLEVPRRPTGVAVTDPEMPRHGRPAAVTFCRRAD